MNPLAVVMAVCALVAAIATFAGSGPEKASCCDRCNCCERAEAERANVGKSCDEPADVDAAWYESKPDVKTWKNMDKDARREQMKPPADPNAEPDGSYSGVYPPS